MGKPRKMTPAAEERVIGALEAGADMALAARLVDVTRRGLYKHMEKHEEFRQRVDDARATADDVIQRSLFQQAKAGHVTAQIFWLKNRRPNEWRDRHEHKVDATADQNITWELQFADGRSATPATEAVSGKADS